MITKIEKIGGKNKLTLSFGNQKFLIDCDSDKETLTYYKSCLDQMIEKHRESILKETKYLKCRQCGSKLYGKNVLFGFCNNFCMDEYFTKVDKKQQSNGHTN